VSRRIRVIAPAKVNLHLSVGALRDDGYHDLEGVFHALELADEVVVEAGEGLSVVCEPDVGVPAEQNLAFRAAVAFADDVGVAPDFRITVRKRIPHGAGLGGGSSDAAAVLRALAHAFGLNADDTRVLGAARSVGADVAFFLGGGAALMGGRGDELVRTLPALNTPVAIVKPDRSISTALAYAVFDTEPQPPADPGPVVAALEAADARGLGRALANNLAPVACALVPECGEVLDWLAEQPGLWGTTVAGSGSAVLALAESDAKAHDIAQAARDRGWWGIGTRLRERGVEVIGEED